ncbi:hypothetical protein MMC30_006922 [Trapelia coarctata]|nr:hypothetical protein [Trapelia coarctata]
MGEDGGPRNMSLYQLLLFESVLRCLRSKFEIPYSIIQDPELTAADRAFLQERGHTVLPYPSRPGFSFRSGVDFPFDSSLLERISNETFSFAPNLDFSVVVDAILAFRPLLYYGHDMFLDGASPHLLHPNSTGHHLRPTYLALATTYTFTHAPLWGRPSTSYGFMYPTQPSLKTARKQQRRIARAEVEKESVMAVLTSVADRQAAEAKGQGLSELRLAIANIGGG